MRLTPFESFKSQLSYDILFVWIACVARLYWQFTAQLWTKNRPINQKPDENGNWQKTVSSYSSAMANTHLNAT